MIEVGQIIPCRPSESSSKSDVNKARVVYIHPAGRFYTVQFDFPLGSFRETRYFTQRELEEAYAMGRFKRPAEQLLSGPGYRPIRQANRDRYTEMEEAYENQEADDMGSLLAML